MVFFSWSTKKKKFEKSVRLLLCPASETVKALACRVALLIGNVAFSETYAKPGRLWDPYALDALLIRLSSVDSRVT